MSKPIMMDGAAEYAKEALKKEEGNWEDLPIERRAKGWFWQAIGELCEMEKSIGAGMRKTRTNSLLTQNRRKESGYYVNQMTI